MRRKLTDIETHHTGHGERDRLMIHTEIYTNMQKYTDTSINPHSITKTPTPKQDWVTKAHIATHTSKHKSPTHQSLGHTHALKATHFTPSFIGVQMSSEGPRVGMNTADMKWGHGAMEAKEHVSCGRDGMLPP